jgi:hypothetical protein
MATIIKAPPARWTEDSLVIFLECLLVEKRQGNFTSTGFKSDAWTRICNSFNRRSSAAYNKAQLHNQYNCLKKKYSKNTSGYVWDEERKMVTVPDDV